MSMEPDPRTPEERFADEAAGARCRGEWHGADRCCILCHDTRSYKGFPEGRPFEFAGIPGRKVSKYVGSDDLWGFDGGDWFGGMDPEHSAG